ncbi:hypothetical protein [Aquipuribacter sp. MA13-6]|uniref:hypothetical protein n=1 Tax=unclassified Aquipuribacter TaxID=2635084 RepID=UPI003EE99C1B
MAEGRTPPWQLTRTSRQGFWLGGLFTVLAVLGWLFQVPGGGPVEVVLAALWTVLALGILASSAALRRRERG